MISLEKIKEKDLKLIAQWKTNQSIIKYIDTKPMITLKEQLNWLKRIRSDNKCIYWIINNYGIKIGIIKLNNIDFEKEICDLEYYIGDLHFRGRKIMPNLIYNIYDYVFEHMKFKEICCNIKISNEHAINISKKMGCEIKEKIEQDNNENEKDRAIQCLYITKEKWNVIKNNYYFEKIFIDDQNFKTTYI